MQITSEIQDSIQKFGLDLWEAVAAVGVLAENSPVEFGTVRNASSSRFAGLFLTSDRVIGVEGGADETGTPTVVSWVRSRSHILGVQMDLPPETNGDQVSPRGVQIDFAEAQYEVCPDGWQLAEGDRSDELLSEVLSRL